MDERLVGKKQASLMRNLAVKLSTPSMTTSYSENNFNALPAVNRSSYIDTDTSGLRAWIFSFPDKTLGRPTSGVW